MFPTKLCKPWTLGGLKTIIQNIDGCSNIERCLVVVGNALLTAYCLH